jgi:hypothetical protein
MVLQSVSHRPVGLSHLLSFLTPLESDQYLGVLNSLLSESRKVGTEEVVPSALAPNFKGRAELHLDGRLVCSFEVSWQSGFLAVMRNGPPSSGYVAPHTLRVRVPPALREFPTSSLVCWLPALQMAHECGNDLAGRLLVEHMRAGQISYPSHLLLQVLAVRIQHKSSHRKTIEVPALSHSSSTFAELAKQAIDPTVPVFLELVDQTTMAAHRIELRAPLTIVPAPSTIFTLDGRDWVDWSKQPRGKVRLVGECHSTIRTV